MSTIVSVVRAKKGGFFYMGEVVAATAKNEIQ